VSVTTVLVPVDEAEVERVLAGGGVGDIAVRAARLRRRVARVDAVREEMHALLFRYWSGAIRPRWSVERWITALRAPGAATPSTGWDPFVHLFGRSLPVVGPDSRAVASTLADIVALEEDEAFSDRLAASLASLDEQAGSVWRGAPAFIDIETIAPRVEGQRARIVAAAASHELVDSLAPLARLSAWSQPVWRFDGHQLCELLALAGIGVTPEPPTALFEERFGVDAVEATSFPARLGDFAGTGGYLTSSAVQLLAGALRLGRTAIARQVGASGEPTQIAMRHLRLLEEAVLFCESRGLGLWETAGLEFHEAG
jgi:hypothetical protein